MTSTIRLLCTSYFKPIFFFNATHNFALQVLLDLILQIKRQKLEIKRSVQVTKLLSDRVAVYLGLTSNPILFLLELMSFLQKWWFSTLTAHQNHLVSFPNYQSPIHTTRGGIQASVFLMLSRELLCTRKFENKGETAKQTEWKAAQQSDLRSVK